MVRAKFRCLKKEDIGDSSSIKFLPVSKTDNPNDENSQFFKYSPSGSIDLCCCNPDALKQFEPGQEYYVDFTPAPLAENALDKDEWDH